MIVGISGKKHSGKSYVAEYLLRHIEGSIRVPIAGKLKEIAQELFGCLPDHVYGSGDAKTRMALCGKSARDVMQMVGQSMRGIWPDCWIHAWEHEVVSLWAEWGVPQPIIVDDVRYPNEAKRIRSMGGLLIRLTRNPAPDNHLSETALDDWREWDLVVDNNFQAPDETAAEILAFCREKGVV